MKLVIGNDPILKEECKEFDFANPPFDPIEFSQNLVQMMYDSNGIGLAANQVGV
jgi:peptide deformylase